MSQSSASGKDKRKRFERMEFDELRQPETFFLFFFKEENRCGVIKMEDSFWPSNMTDDEKICMEEGSYIDLRFNKKIQSSKFLQRGNHIVY